MSGYVLTDSAEADLRDIVRYTRGRWGEAQARSYIAKLERGIERLAAGDGPFRDVSDIYPRLRMGRCEHHYLFCLPRDDAPSLVVALFHERMDSIARLAGRL